ncbi:MAG: hypothetical protein AABW68_04615 [archaeon]
MVYNHEYVLFSGLLFLRKWFGGNVFLEFVMVMRECLVRSQWGHLVQ